MQIWEEKIDLGWQIWGGKYLKLNLVQTKDGPDSKIHEVHDRETLRPFIIKAWGRE